MDTPDPLDRLADEHRSFRWATALRTVGWLAVVGFILQVLAQLRRAAEVTSSSFPDGVWGRRMELLSFAALPGNLIPFLVAAIAVAAAAYLLPGVADRAEVGITRLLRVVDGCAYAVLALAAIGIADQFWQGIAGADSLASVASRIVGALLAIGVIRLVRESERHV